MLNFTVGGHEVELDPEQVELSVEHELPDPVVEHYVVVRGRRYPPKQVLACATGLDRADFTTHQARRILMRLGFVAARARRGEPEVAVADTASSKGVGPHAGRQAAALAPYAGQWVALDGPTEVLVAAGNPQDVLAWLARHGKRATGMFRVPTAPSESEGAAPA